MTGLYVHVPFCARACPYCDFDFEVGRRPEVARYLGGLAVEADARGLGGRCFPTIYVGGGTPSILGANGLGALFAWIDATFPGSGDVERTVELNPEHVEPRLLDCLLAGGVDRVSLGVQSFDDAGLRQLGRAHTSAEAIAASAAIQRLGLRSSLDLIVGWPGQTAASLADELTQLVDTGVDHLSIYALTIEVNSPWPALVRRGLRILPDADAQAEALEQVERVLTAAGFTHYEVASYARAGAEARHNMLYWTWKDYVGLGPSAASAAYRDDGSVCRRSNPRGLAAWESGSPAEVEILRPEQAAREGLWVGLRKLEAGVDIASFLRTFPGVDRRWIDARIARPLARGNLEWREGGAVLRVRPGRWIWHDAIGEAILG